MFSTAFFGGGPLVLLPLLRLTLSFELESSFSGVAGEVSLSSLDFRDPLFGRGEAFGLLEDLLSDSDSELLSGEKILFFLEVSDLEAFCIVFGIGFGVLAPAGTLGPLPLASTAAADLGFAEHRLRGAAGFCSTTFGVSSSLDEDGLGFVDGLLGLGSSFFLGSSLLVLTGDFGGCTALAAGVSEVDDSESELLEPEPELVDELPLLLESDVDPELLSVLVLFT